MRPKQLADGQAARGPATLKRLFDEQRSFVSSLTGLTLQSSVLQSRALEISDLTCARPSTTRSTRFCQGCERDSEILVRRHGRCQGLLGWEAQSS